MTLIVVGFMLPQGLLQCLVFNPQTMDLLPGVHMGVASAWSEKGLLLGHYVGPWVGKSSLRPQSGTAGKESEGCLRVRSWDQGLQP